MHLRRMEILVVAGQKGGSYLGGDPHLRGALYQHNSHCPRQPKIKIKPAMQLFHVKASIACSFLIFAAGGTQHET